MVVLTSNRTREVHDAIRRRCLYHWVDYPDAARERAILAAKAPGVPEALSAQVVAFVQRLRGEDLFKLPGVAETIDWASALTYLNQHELTPQAVDETLGVLLKYQDDIAKHQRRRGGPAGRRGQRGGGVTRRRRPASDRLAPTSCTSRACCAAPGCRSARPRPRRRSRRWPWWTSATKTEARTALRAAMIHRHEHQEVFDQAFALFWRDPTAGAAGRRHGAAGRAEGEDAGDARRRPAAASPRRWRPPREPPPVASATSRRHSTPC